jgi:protein-S-isoprenylcysteine O-methyltransferase Ste14
MGPLRATFGLWALWALSWVAAAVWTRSTAARAPFARLLAYSIPLALGYWMILLAAGAPVRRLQALVSHARLWPSSDAFAWLMVLAAAAGFAFTWWARLTLGSLWSGTITRKEGHHVVESGPYGLVRHPIYTGLLLATLASALEIATPLAFLGFAFATLGYWLKARFEEHFLGEQLGEAAYADYRRRVPMLTPFWPKG